MSTVNGSVKATVKASELFAPANQRRKVRHCKDCTLLNPGSENHTDPDYCPTCVGKHLTQCRGCRAQFHRDGLNKHCRSCRDQLALFGAQFGAQSGAQS